jgi:hypothetical protein
MIKEPFGYGGTFYSKVQYPDTKGLMNQVYVFDKTLKRIGDTIDLKLTVSFRLADFYDDKKYWEVIKSQSSYKLEVVGDLTIQDAYKVFEHSMVCLIHGLHDHERKNEIPVTTNLHPLPLQEILPELNHFVQEYYKAG